MVLELQIANRKMVDLEAKIQKMEKEKREQNHGELIFNIILHSIPMMYYTRIVNLLILFLNKYEYLLYDLRATNCWQRSD